MEINYIILAHKNPQQVQRLIKLLNTNQCNFYIHIDKGVDINPFNTILTNHKNVNFLDENLREYGTWGDIGIVKATIAVLSKIVKDNRSGYCVLLSGQDYPLKNNESINEFLTINYGTNFIDIFPLPNKGGWGIDGGLNRLKQYKINISTARLDFIQLPSLFEKTFYKRQTIGKLKKLFKSKQFYKLSKLFIKRRLSKNIKAFGGSQWWAFPIETIQIVLAFIHANPKYLNYHKNTLLPDEIFFHSILKHLSEKNDLIIKPSITYVNWERKNTPLPVIFSEYDFKELKEISNNKLFARKFDVNYCEKILDLLDKSI